MPPLGGVPISFRGGSGAAASPLAQQRDRVAALLLLVTLAAALGAQEGWRAGTAPPWGKGPPQGTETPLGERMPPGKRTPPPPPGERVPQVGTHHIAQPPPPPFGGPGPPKCLLSQPMLRRGIWGTPGHSPAPRPPSSGRRAAVCGRAGYRRTPCCRRAGGAGGQGSEAGSLPSLPPPPPPQHYVPPT